MIFHWTPRSGQVSVDRTWQPPCFFMAFRVFLHTHVKFHYTLQRRVWGNSVVDRFGGTLEKSTKERSNGSIFFLENSKILYHFVFVSATDFKHHKKWDTWYLKNLPTFCTHFFNTLKHSNIEKRHMKETFAKQNMFAFQPTHWNSPMILQMFVFL